MHAMKQWLLGGRVPEHMFIPAAVTASEAKNVMCVIIPDMALKFLCWRYGDTYFFCTLGLWQEVLIVPSLLDLISV